MSVKIKTNIKGNIKIMQEMKLDQGRGEVARSRNNDVIAAKSRECNRDFLKST